jgi:hypothetical protein
VSGQLHASAALHLKKESQYAMDRKGGGGGTELVRTLWRTEKFLATAGNRITPVHLYIHVIACVDGGGGCLEARHRRPLYAAMKKSLIGFSVS